MPEVLLHTPEHSPSFVYDEALLLASCKRWAAACRLYGISQYFPLKCQNLPGPLVIIREHVSGFAASSLFEAKLANDVGRADQRIHFTSPAIRADEIEQLL